MWREFDKSGQLVYGNFLETVVQLFPMYWARAIGGSLYLLGVVLCAINMLMTWFGRPKEYEVTVHEAPALEPLKEEKVKLPPVIDHTGLNVNGVTERIEYFNKAEWHRRWERLPVTFIVMVTVAVVVASLFEVIPTFLKKSDVPKLASVKPYTALELAGRDIYIREGCSNCHSQMIRPIRAETERYGEYSKPGEFVYDRPFLWGSRRIGPDLHRIGGKYPHRWHYDHMKNPRDPEFRMTKSIMPAYPWLHKDKTDFASLPTKLRTLSKLGVPYTRQQIGLAKHHAKWQARKIVAEMDTKGLKGRLENKEIIALIAYLQRLGTDIKRSPKHNPFAMPEAELKKALKKAGLKKQKPKAKAKTSKTPTKPKARAHGK